MLSLGLECLCYQNWTTFYCVLLLIIEEIKIASADRKIQNNLVESEDFDTKNMMQKSFVTRKALFYIENIVRLLSWWDCLTLAGITTSVGDSTWLHLSDDAVRNSSRDRNSINSLCEAIWNRTTDRNPVFWRKSIDITCSLPFTHPRVLWRHYSDHSEKEILLLWTSEFCLNSLTRQSCYSSHPWLVLGSFSSLRRFHSCRSRRIQIVLRSEN